MLPSPSVSRLLNDCEPLLPPLLMPLEALSPPPLPLRPLDVVLPSLGVVLDWLLLAAKAGAAANARMHARIVWCFICVLLDVSQTTSRPANAVARKYSSPCRRNSTPKTVGEWRQALVESVDRPRQHISDFPCAKAEWPAGCTVRGASY